MELRELDADGGLTVPQGVERGLERRGDAERRLVADERVLLVLVFSEPVAQGAGSARRESAEGEAARRESAHEKRHVDGARTGNDLVGHPFFRTGADEPVTRIGDARVAAVRTERDFLARLHRRDDRLGDALLVALTVRDHVRTRNLEVRQELPGATRVFAGNERSGLEGVQSPRREIAEVSDGSGNDVKHKSILSVIRVRGQT